MTFIDGMVAAVPNANREAFLKHAKDAAEVFKEAGAVKVSENWGVDVPDGELTSMAMAVKKEAEETVVFSWIVWPDKDTRDAGWAKVMEDPRMRPDVNPMPFDGKRMIFGGFETILDV